MPAITNPNKKDKNVSFGFWVSLKIESDAKKIAKDLLNYIQSQDNLLCD